MAIGAPITLHHLALTAEGLYLIEPLRALERAYPADPLSPGRPRHRPVAGDLVQAVNGAGAGPRGATPALRQWGPWSSGCRASCSSAACR